MHRKPHFKQSTKLLKSELNKDLLHYYFFNKHSITFREERYNFFLVYRNANVGGKILCIDIYIRSLSCTSGVQLPSPQLITRLLGQPISTVTSCTERNGRLENKKKLFHAILKYSTAWLIISCYVHTFSRCCFFFLWKKNPRFCTAKKHMAIQRRGWGL